MLTELRYRNSGIVIFRILPFEYQILTSFDWLELRMEVLLLLLLLLFIIIYNLIRFFKLKFYTEVFRSKTGFQNTTHRNQNNTLVTLFNEIKPVFRTP